MLCCTIPTGGGVELCNECYAFCSWMSRAAVGSVRSHIPLIKLELLWSVPCIPQHSFNKMGQLVPTRFHRPMLIKLEVCWLCVTSLQVHGQGP